jgi:hypothetical protein
MADDGLEVFRMEYRSPRASQRLPDSCGISNSKAPTTTGDGAAAEAEAHITIYQPPLRTRDGSSTVAISTSQQNR